MKKVIGSDLEVLMISEGFFDEILNLLLEQPIGETEQLLQPQKDEYKAFTSRS